VISAGVLHGPTKLLLLVTVVWLSVSPAQTPTGDAPECHKQGIGKLQLTQQDTTILGLTIGSASLKDVRAKLGQTGFLPRNESSPNTVCYVSPTDGTVLSFGAGAMGGFVDVTEFSLWSREARFPNVKACLPSKLISPNLSTLSGIKLGLSLQQLNTIVGAVPTTKHAEAHYELSCREKMTPEEIKRFKTANNWDVSDNPCFAESCWTATQRRTNVAALDIYFPSGNDLRRNCDRPVASPKVCLRWRFTRGPDPAG